MTELRRSVRRITAGEYRVIRVGIPRRVVVSLLPGDVIEFREMRSRQRYLLAIDTAFRIAVKRHAELEKSNKKGRARK